MECGGGNLSRSPVSEQVRTTVIANKIHTIHCCTAASVSAGGTIDNSSECISLLQLNRSKAIGLIC